MFYPHCILPLHYVYTVRSLSMELVKLFMLKHADAEPVIINNITFAQEHAATAQQALGDALVEHLEVLVRTLLVLQEVCVFWICVGAV